MSIDPKILIVEDEKKITNFMKATLTANHYEVLTTPSGREAVSLLSSHCPDLMLLDLGLPDIDGLEVIAQARKWSGIPIIVVSARMQEQDKVLALDLGADDYITKPFGTDELLARIRAALRHSLMRKSRSQNIGSFNTGALYINFEKRLVTVNGEPVHLTQNEYKIVSLLALNAGKVITYDMLLKELWGPGVTENNQMLRVHMANIRRKLEENPAEPRYLFTEVGVGYRMADADT